jgi:tRNA(fMet)-specific endonuclease VapC
MAMILDSDVIIQGEKGRFDLESWLASRTTDVFEIAAVSIAELWHGAERGKGVNRVARLSYLETVLQPLAIIPYTEQTAYEHARIWAELEASGKMIGFCDLIVAATALERDGQVVTFNKRHFTKINGLRVIEPAL